MTFLKCRIRFKFFRDEKKRFHASGKCYPLLNRKQVLMLIFGEKNRTGEVVDLERDENNKKKKKTCRTWRLPVLNKFSESERRRH